MNVQNRVNELLEKDEIEKQRQLKEVEDFYRDIEEDLIVVCLYEVKKNGFMIIHKAYFDHFINENIKQILEYMLKTTSEDVYKENLEFVEKFNKTQLIKFYEIMGISLKNNGMKINRISSGYYLLDEFFRIEEIEEIGDIEEIKEEFVEDTSIIEETDKKFKLNIPLTCLLFLMIVILLIIVFLPVK